VSELEPEEVDLDLDLIGEKLREERVGEPTSVRIDGEVIHVRHAAAWSSTAMRAASIGNWEQWAEEVISDKEEFAHWIAADLENFQIEAIFDACGRKARMTVGKSVRHGGSRRHSRKK
jgi:hypothetical protein